MFHHKHSIVAVLALTLVFCASVCLAAETTKGKVLKAGDAKLTFTDRANEELTWDVAGDAKITRNGKPATLIQLEVGDAVEITFVKKAAKSVVTAILGRSSE